MNRRKLRLEVLSLFGQCLMVRDALLMCILIILISLKARLLVGPRMSF